MATIDPYSIAGKAPQPDERYELVVVGAGPAGLAAAIAAARAGARVLLVDEHPVDGATMGLEVPHHWGQRMTPAVHNKARLLETVAAADPDLATAFELGVEVRLGVAAWGAFAPGPSARALPGPLLGLADETRAWLVGFENLIVATGARDLGIGFAGWELPGVMGAAAANALIARYDAFAGRRLVILGGGATAVGLAELAIARGLDVAAMVDVGLGRREPAGIDILARHVIVAATGGSDGVSAAEVAPLDAGGSRRIDCDTICLGIGLVPNIEIPALLGCTIAYRPERGGYTPVLDVDGRSSVPSVSVVGDAAGAWDAKTRDADIARAEGRRAVAAILGTPREANVATPPTGDGDNRRAWLAAQRAVGGADVMACVCEAVTREALQTLQPPRYLERTADRRHDLAALGRDGPLDQDQVKRLTRAGMGPCQGRRCREQVGLILADAAGVEPGALAMPSWRAPIRPLPLAVLATLDEPAAMVAHWDAWFGIDVQYRPYWEIAGEAAP
jgi:thioredoxin reductase